MSDKKYGVIIHPERFDDLLGASPEVCGKVVQNMIRVFMGEERTQHDESYTDLLSKIMCERVEYDKKISDRNSRNGSRGGGQFGNTNAEKTSEKRAKNERKTSDIPAKTNHKDKDKNKDKDNNKDNKRLYGECANVLLSDEEYEKIKTGGMIGLIDELSLYIASTGKTYKSHYAVIRQWANRRKNETKVIKPTQFNTGLMQRPVEEYDLDKLIKN